MKEIAAASLNTFGPVPKVEVSPSEDPIFVLTAGQLKEIISQAIQPLQDEVMELKATVASQQAEMASMKADIKLDGHDIRDLFDALASLEQSHIQPLQRDRGEILRALIAANGGKMLATDARAKMRMDKATFSRLLASLESHIGTKPFHQDKRQLVLIIK